MNKSRTQTLWLNTNNLDNQSLLNYRKVMLASCPRHIIIDDMFDTIALNSVLSAIQHSSCWRTQKHTYDNLYVNDQQWHRSSELERFVKRDVWTREHANNLSVEDKYAESFLVFLRSPSFLSILSTLFSVDLTDVNVAKPEINSNYFRLSPDDFIGEHADNSPGRKVCMLLYLNQNWQANGGGELVFSGHEEQHVSIEPHFNRCVLFDPASSGSEHWVKSLNRKYASAYRYNVTSWYWSE